MCQILKHPSKKHLAYFLYQDNPQLIFNSKEGIIPEILTRSFQLVDNMLTTYSKVTAVLVQLHQAQPTEGNQLLTIMLQRLKTTLKKRYRCKVGYFWVREQSDANSQHYHMIVFLSGHKCQQSKLVDIASDNTWKSIHPDNFRFKPRNRIYRIKRDGGYRELRALRMRMSYMAKKEGKSTIAPYVNSYQCSRLTKA